MFLRRLFTLSCALGAFVLLAEVAIRGVGLVDFPIYSASADIGYIPAPNQSGRFLRKNDWQFNEKSMGAPHFAPSSATDILLIGDSIVLGGNPLPEDEKLGPQLSRASSNVVWPVSAGSWALRNELAYLRLHPDVVRSVDQFVFVSNKGDFAEASSWACERTHPTAPPRWAGLYLFRKHLWDWDDCTATPQNLRFASGNWQPELRSFLRMAHVRGKPLTWVLYPYLEDKVASGGLSALEAAGRTIAAEAREIGLEFKLVSVARDPRWSADLYRDPIHPTSRGTKVLAQIIAQPASQAVLDD